MKKFDVGNEIEVDFISNAIGGGKPVCRVNGIVGFINKDSKDYIHVGSTWIVRIDEIKPRCLIVTPLYERRTSKENSKLMEEKKQKLVEAWNRKV